MAERLTHSQLCDLLAGLMEYRILIETLPLGESSSPDRLWKHIITYADKIAREKEISRKDMIGHLVCLGLTVEASTPEMVSRLIDELK